MNKIELRIFKGLVTIFGINIGSKITKTFYNIYYWIKYQPRIYITRLDRLYLKLILKNAKDR